MSDQGIKNANGKSTHAPTSSWDIPEKPPPPDGGWGWMVVFAAFIIHIIIDGMTYSFGIFFDEFLFYFKETKSKTAWIGSLLTGFTLCSGPVTSWLMNRWGCKLVAVSGALLAFAGMSLSAFAANVLTLTFTVGVTTGLGIGLMYLPAIVSVSIWFERRRSLATGIAVCGSGLGMFIFPPMTKALILAYGWRYAIAIIGTLNLICVPLGLALRPVPAVTPVPDEKKSSLKGSQSDDAEHMARANENFEDDEVVTVTLSESEEKQPSHSRHGSIIIQTPDVLCHESMPSFTKPRSSLDKTQFKINDEKEKRGWLSSFAEYKSVLINPFFVIFCIANFVTNIGYYIPIMYTQNMSKGLGISNPEYVTSIIGIGSLLGRTVLGYISDKPWVNRLVVYNSCLIVAGISTAFAALCTDFKGLAVFAVTFGFTSGAYVTLTSVVLVDIVGVDKVPNAMGLLILVLGSSSLIGPPILGAIYDVTKSYPLVYYVAGALVVLSGVIPFLIPLLKRRAMRARSEQELSLEQI